LLIAVLLTLAVSLEAAPAAQFGQPGRPGKLFSTPNNSPNINFLNLVGGLIGGQRPHHHRPGAVGPGEFKWNLKFFCM
jgi:hypothetical protein